MRLPTVLVALTSQEFSDTIPPTSTARHLRHQLARSSQVKALKGDLASCSVSDEHLKSFVAELLSAFAPGTTLEGELALAAIAVAVEDHHSLYASSLLHTLGSLRVPEVAMASWVARECLKTRPPIRTLVRREPVDLSDRPAPSLGEGIVHRRDHVTRIRSTRPDARVLEVA